MYLNLQDFNVKVILKLKAAEYTFYKVMNSPLLFRTLTKLYKLYLWIHMNTI